ncbi:MAG: hypothetical protein Q9184_005078 [Pyrenodesmia sp. 2 TL-2023]
MVVILYFMFSTYATNPLIGSPARMYRLLTEASAKRPLIGNWDGSYTTLKSNLALVYGVIQLCGGTATVFLDQAYWQRAIASRPTTAVRAYLLGGIAWFAIPFGFATTLGLAAIALTDDPSFPTYPEVPTRAQITAGLSAPFAATALLGTGGAVALLIVLFMAVTSCLSAELIALSSILTFDIYKTYIKPLATPDMLIVVAHSAICIAGLIIAAFACIFNVVGIDLGWLFLALGVMIGGAVFPAAFAITWKGQTRAGAVAGAISGLCTGMMAWLVAAKQYYGELTVTTTGSEYSILAGNLTAIFVGLIVSICVSLAKPESFDWEMTRAINSAASLTASTRSSIDVDKADGNNGDKTSKISKPAAIQDERQQTARDAAVVEEPSKLRSAFKTACILSILMTLTIDVVVPIPMFLSHYIFTQGFFVAWVVITFIWVFCSTAISVILPLWETRVFFGQLYSKMFFGDRDVR